MNSSLFHPPPPLLTLQTRAEGQAEGPLVMDLVHSSPSSCSSAGLDLILIKAAVTPTEWRAGSPKRVTGLRPRVSLSHLLSWGAGTLVTCRLHLGPTPSALAVCSVAPFQLRLLASTYRLSPRSFVILFKQFLFLHRCRICLFAFCLHLLGFEQWAHLPGGCKDTLRRLQTHKQTQ